MVVMRTASRNAAAAIDIVMLGGMRVPGEADARTIADDIEQLQTVRGVDGRVARVEMAAQRNVHRGDDKSVRRSLPEHLSHKVELSFAETAPVFAAALIVDIVEHKKQCVAIFKGIITWTKRPFECFF